MRDWLISFAIALPITTAAVAFMWFSPANQALLNL